MTPRQGIGDKLGWRNSANSQTSKTINLSANCSDRLIHAGQVFDYLLCENGKEYMYFVKRREDTKHIKTDV